MSQEPSPSDIMAISRDTLRGILPPAVSITAGKDIVTGTCRLGSFSVTASVAEHKTVLPDRLLVLVEVCVKGKPLPRTVWLTSKIVNVLKLEDIVNELNVTKAIFDSLATLIHDNPPEVVAGWMMRKK